MTEPLEGQMLPNAAPPTWPDLAYWRDRALRQQELLSEQSQVIERLEETAQRLEELTHKQWAALQLQRLENDALRQELEAERRKLECALDLVAELAHRLAVPPTDSTRAAIVKSDSRKHIVAPFPPRALQVWR